jgi:hypothetical protein
LKRSEMIGAIHNKLNGTPIDHDNYARQFLDVVEELGMLPPSSIHELGNCYSMSDCTHVIQRDGKMYGAAEMNRWEPEDE